MKNSFFAMLSRMKLISRWGLMRNSMPENIAEHSFDTALLAHALAVIKNKRFGGNVDAGRVVMLALYHDAPEIFTGDMPTPVKYFNPSIRNEYKQVEKASLLKLLSYLPDDLRGDYEDVMVPKPEDKELLRIVKAADKLSALIKCIEEEKAGSREFKKAAAAQEKTLKEMNMPEVECFMKEFLPAFSLTIDELESE
ncbi:metal dependent phosphohydrolase [[Clostridium] cellulosi]|jgi:HD domain.|uniref:Metal dependent phosphohydrolase n=1 Tax=[Clostridium] cellulosi TaxID=29343 RepID=A0A078KQ59_9FIRM|nr:metal dependent phosphohydrolase [[Clostridium] cellulosi]